MLPPPYAPSLMGVVVRVSHLHCFGKICVALTRASVPEVVADLCSRESAALCRERNERQWRCVQLKVDSGCWKLMVTAVIWSSYLFINRTQVGSWLAGPVLGNFIFSRALWSAYHTHSFNVSFPQEARHRGCYSLCRP